MNKVQATIHKIDSFQRHYRFPGFTYAVIKKYGEDQAGYQAALLTYFAFLSLFPLLLVLTTLTGLIPNSNVHLQNTIINGLTNYFPVLGDQLSNHVHSLHRSGIALIIGIIFTLYGAKGVADAFRSGVNHIWRIPQVDRDGFPKATLKSLSIMIGGGLGLITASVIAGFASGIGHGLGVRLVSIVLNIAILYGLFLFLINVALPKHVPLKDTRAGALTAAIGLVILQAAGTYLLSRELKNLDALYSYFAVPLGLLFWLYLQTQVMYYAVEVAAVHAQKLWPRSLTGDDLTKADKASYSNQAHKQKIVKDEVIMTNFDTDPNTAQKMLKAVRRNLVGK